jgi:ABC-type sugar transport system permease subunit
VIEQSQGAATHAAPGALQPAAPQPRLTVEQRRSLARGYRLRRALVAYAFLAPNLVFFFLFLLLPCGWVLYATLQNGGVLGPATFVGLENWRSAFADPLLRTAMQNTFYYGVLAVPAVFVIAMVLALFLLNVRKGGAVIRSILYFPTLSPVVLAALMWLFVVHPDFGIFNLGLRALGFGPINWLGSTRLALPTIAMLEVWRGTGFWTLLFLAALLGIPSELYQAAHLDGANAWQRFRYLTLPLLRPTFLFAAVMATIWNLQLFDSVYVMTDGGPVHSTATVVWYVYKSLFQFGNVGFAATLSFVLMLVILVLTLVELRVLRLRRAG